MLDFHLQKVIPSLSKKEDVEAFVYTQMKYCIILNVDLSELQEIINLVHECNKLAFVHIDYIRGIAVDEYGCNYLCNVCGADGILSLNSDVILAAKNNKKVAIQRVFLVDSATLENEMIKINSNKPDYVELIPGIANEIYSVVQNNIQCKIIAGGLLKTTEQMYDCLVRGASAVSVSSLILAEKFQQSYLD